MKSKIFNFKKTTSFFIFLVACFLFSSCGTEERTVKAIEWVNTHPKPIIVTSVTMNGMTNNYRCMFMDSAGIVYYAGEVEGFQPDTIK